MNLLHRPRRLRQNTNTRALVCETQLSPADFILPVFVCEGVGKIEAISSLPGVNRYSLDQLLIFLQEVVDHRIPAISLFPKIDESLKDSIASESLNQSGLLLTTVRKIKAKFPELLIMTDVAMDPYSSDGHDGLVQNGEILNDPSVEILCKMAVAQARAGADFVGPSDMMDGRVEAIRIALDQDGFEKVGIISYTAKYASALYGPFRDALDSTPKAGDKKTYQMDPANANEAVRELELDEIEGADIVMVKPATLYLDIIRLLAERATVPVAAYHVSGEYAMACAAAQNGWLKLEDIMMESLLAIKRAGAKIILSYYALEAAKILRKG